MKHYIRLNVASPDNWYWNQPAQNWTSDATQATVFDSDQEAAIESRYAQRDADGEVIVCVYAPNRKV